MIRHPRLRFMQLPDLNLLIALDALLEEGSVVGKRLPRVAFFVTFDERSRVKRPRYVTGDCGSTASGTPSCDIRIASQRVL